MSAAPTTTVDVEQHRREPRPGRRRAPGERLAEPFGAHRAACLRGAEGERQGEERRRRMSGVGQAARPEGIEDAGRAAEHDAVRARSPGSARRCPARRAARGR